MEDRTTAIINDPRNKAVVGSADMLKQSSELTQSAQREWIEDEKEGD